MAKVVAEAEELPKAIVRRVVKDKLSLCSKGDGDLTLLKEALLAFSESPRIFIHYLSATANDICKEKKRQTINADDVLKALEEIEFSEFIKPLEASLKGKNEGKNAGKNAEKSRGKNAGKQKAGTSKSKEVKKTTKMKMAVMMNEQASIFLFFFSLYLCSVLLNRSLKMPMLLLKLGL